METMEFVHMPNEIVVSIFRYVPSVDLVRARATCKRFNCVVKSNRWHQLVTIRSITQAIQFHAMKINFTNCKLIGKFVTDEILALFTNCTRVVLKFCPNITDYGLCHLASNCTELTIRYCDEITGSTIPLLTRCTTLSLMNNYGIDDSSAKYFAHISNLTLRNFDERYSKGFDEALYDDEFYGDDDRADLITSASAPFFANCDRLAIKGFDEITDNEATVQHFSNCRVLELPFYKIKDSNAKYFEKCEELCLDDSKVLDHHTFYFRNCTRLSLSNTLVTDACAINFANCTHLNLADCAITDQSIPHFVNCTSLNLSDTLITDECTVHLRNCTDLSVSGTKVTSTSLVNFANCTNLNLSGCEITDLNTEYLINCQNLRLYGCGKLTNASMPHFRNCRFFGISANDNITKDGLKYLVNCTGLMLWRCKHIERIETKKDAGRFIN